MEGFLTFLLFTIIGFWLLGKIARWALQFWITRKQKEFSRQFGGYGDANTGRQKQDTGKVHVSVDPQTEDKKVNKNIGDYVEFEEVDKTVS